MQRGTKFLARRAVPTAAVLALLLGVGPAAAPARADTADTLAMRLATLRGEIEQLSEQLTSDKTEFRNELQALARQKADLQVELDREQVRIAKLRSALGKKREQVEQSSSQDQDLGPVYDAAVEGLRGYIEASLPFRRHERLAELAKIDEQRRTGVLTYPRALVRLWGLVEDELRMTRESAAYQQTVTVDGDERLAEVIRVGMVMIFFQTSDGVLGYSRRTAGDWEFVRAASADERKQIRALFDSFKKQIRVGMFLLPNALPAEKTVEEQ